VSTPSLTRGVTQQNLITTHSPLVGDHRDVCAKIMPLYEGTSQIQRLVIARETLAPRHVEALTSVAA
jgi:hypothetical protein